MGQVLCSASLCLPVGMKNWPWHQVLLDFGRDSHQPTPRRIWVLGVLTGAFQLFITSHFQTWPGHRRLPAFSLGRLTRL